jgi:hypothetical protein
LLGEKALHDQFTKPSGLSDEEASAIKIIERAVSNSRTEVQVHRFPNQLCTDRGRAINQQEAPRENDPVLEKAASPRPFFGIGKGRTGAAHPSGYSTLDFLRALSRR